MATAVHNSQLLQQMFPGRIPSNSIHDIDDLRDNGKQLASVGVESSAESEGMLNSLSALRGQLILYPYVRERAVRRRPCRRAGCH